MTVTLPSFFSKHARVDIKRWVLRQALIVMGITTTVAVGLVLAFDQRWVPTLIYCFCITFCCTFFVQALRYGSVLLRQRLGLTSPVPEEAYWPGWPLMIVSLVAGTAIGYSTGTEIGNWFTGFQEHGLHQSSLRHGLTVMLISLIPGLGLTFYFVGRGRLDAAEARAQTAQRQAAENQLRLLESQLEPHMLFNTLANLRVLIGMDPARAQLMLDQLIAFLRATLNASRTGSHSLREEFARLADYLALMQIRMGARLRPQLDLPAELAELAIPPLLLQPLVENAIKHGLEPNIDGGELRVSARRTPEGQLLLEVMDTGVGIKAAPASEGTPPGTHFGLHQVRERLATRYGPAAILTMEPAPGAGTRVRIQLPIAWNSPTALIAEDEPLLAENLRQELAKLWPELQIVAMAPHGAAAVERALALRPNICFLDIRMPGLSGLEAAAALAEDWSEGAPFPLLVFVTAYDQYALQAFEHAAVDYVLKPVQPDRLAQTVARLKTALAPKDAPAPGLQAAVEQLRALLGTPAPAPATAPLRLLQVGVGNAIVMVPVDEVLYFEAADKYVRVLTAAKEHLVRISLRELLPQLDMQRFWQIHRGVIVRSDAIARAVRDEAGKITLHLHGSPDLLVVSRMYAHLFKSL